MSTELDTTWSISALLCDHAQVADNKLFISGGGISLFQHGNAISFIAMKINVPWNEANIEHDFRALLVDEDGNEVVGPNGDRVAFEAKFEQGRPPGMPHGTSIDLPMAIGISPLNLSQGQYVWHLDIDGKTIDVLRFMVLS